MPPAPPLLLRAFVTAVSFVAIAAFCTGASAAAATPAASSPVARPFELVAVELRETAGDGDGTLDAGESAELTVTLRALGPGGADPAPRIDGTLSANAADRTDAASIEIVRGAANWPALAPGSTGRATFEVRAAESARCGDAALLELNLVLARTSRAAREPLVWRLPAGIGQRWLGTAFSIEAAAPVAAAPAARISAAGDGDGFAVLVTRISAPAEGSTPSSTPGSTLDLSLVRLDASGALRDVHEIAEVNGNVLHQRLARGAVGHAAAWIEADGTTARVMFRRVDADGVAREPARVLHAERLGAGGDVLAGAIDIAPDRASDSASNPTSNPAPGWVVAWQSSAVRGALYTAFVGADGAPTAPAIEVARDVQAFALSAGQQAALLATVARDGVARAILLAPDGERRAIALGSGASGVPQIEADAAFSSALVLTRRQEAGRAALVVQRLSIDFGAAPRGDSTAPPAASAAEALRIAADPAGLPLRGVLAGTGDRALLTLLDRTGLPSLIRPFEIPFEGGETTVRAYEALALPGAPDEEDIALAAAAAHGRLLVAWSDADGVGARVAWLDARCGAGAAERNAPSAGSDGPEIVCNGIDDDDNASTPDAPDADGDTYDVCGPGDIVNPDGKPADCNDARSDVFPGALEFCDGADNDCDATTDGVTGTRYVAPGGSDTANLCTSSASPCATFNHAIRAACAGETVLAAEGTYVQNVVLDKAVAIDNIGLSTATTLQGTGTGDVVRIAASGASWDGVEVRGGGSNAACLRIGGPATPNVRNVTVGNAAFYDCKQGIVVENTGNDPTFLGINRLSQVDCRDNDGDGSARSGLGVLLTGLNGRFEIKGGLFRNNGGSGIRIEAAPSGTSTNLLVNGARIESNGLLANADGRAGVEVLGGADVRIEGNDIFGHTGTGTGDDGRGIAFSGVTSAAIACNRVRDNDTGLAIETGVGALEALHNRFSGNLVRAASTSGTSGPSIRFNEDVFTGNAAGVVHGGSGTLDLRHNWWGAANGPSGAGGSGDSVSGSVDVAGFIARTDEPVLVRRPIDSGWSYPSAACYDMLQPAIDAAPAGSLLLVGSGNPFFERLTISKPLGLEGIPASVAGGCSTSEIYGAQGSPPNRPALRIDNTSGVTLRHLTIHAAGENTPSCETHSGDEIGLDLRNVDNSTFQDLCLQENGIAEIRIYGDSDNNLFQRIDIDGQLCLPGQGCLCTHRSRYGVLLDGGPACEGGGGAFADNNRILDSKIVNVAEGVHARLARTTEVGANTIRATTTPSWYSGALAIGVHLLAADDTLVRDNTIDGTGHTEGIRLAGKGAADCFTEELDTDRALVRDNTIRQATSAGLLLRRQPSDPGRVLAGTIRCNDFNANGTGVRAEEPDGASPTAVTLNDIRGNGTGLRNVGIQSMPATRNWWNATSGPSGNGPGTGDSVFGAVEYAQWLASSARNDIDGDGFTECGGDCNDTTQAIRPGATETCNQIDDDCDGSVDEGLPQNTFYRDADGDSYGNAAVTTTACGTTPPAGYVANSSDCNDANPAINPAAAEVPCDNIDQRCNGAADETPDADGDTFDVCGPTDPLDPDGKPADCNDASAAIRPGATEIGCDGIDQACNGPGDEGPDQDNDNVDRCGAGDPANPDGLPADCDDQDPQTSPFAIELCDAKDNDCDGTVDDGLPRSNYHRDADADGFGAAAQLLQACVAPPGYVTDNTDCNDTSAAAHPGLAEICTDQLDNDCNGTTDAADPVCSGLVVTNLDFAVGSKTTLQWSAAAGSNASALYRGTIGAGGSFKYNHRSLASELNTPTTRDTAVPPPTEAFYYLATGLSIDGGGGNITAGPLGARSNGTSIPDSKIVTAGPRVFVDPDAVAGGGTGLSWADAYTSVSSALRHARAPARGLEVWVKGTVAADSVTFDGAQRGGVMILGGFAGNESTSWARDPALNPSTWSGSAAGSLMRATRAGVVLDGMRLDVGIDGVVLSGTGAALEMRGVTALGFTGRAVDLTVQDAAGSSLVVDGCSFGGAGQRSVSALVRAGTLDGRVRGNSFTGAAEAAIRLEADPLDGTARVATIVERNTIRGGSRGVWLSARADDDGFPATIDGPLRSNLVYGTTVEALRIEATGAFSTLAAASRAEVSPVVANNTLVDGAAGVVCSVARTDTTANPSLHTVRATPALWNNLVTHMSGAAVSESSDAEAQNLSADPRLVANVLFSASPLYRDEGSTDLSIAQVDAIDGNGDNTAQDPLYVSRPLRDYHLAAGSPAVDAGRADAPQTGAQDIDGEARVQGAVIDRGADER